MVKLKWIDERKYIRHTHIDANHEYPKYKPKIVRIL